MAFTAVTVGVPVMVHVPLVGSCRWARKVDNVAPLTLTIPVFTPVLESRIRNNRTGEAA